MNSTTPEILEKLIRIGFTEREAKVYLVLLHRGESTAYELQKFSDVPNSKVYETINKLVSKGYLNERKEGRKRTLFITDPRASFESHISSLEKQIQLTEEIRDEISGIYLKHEKQTVPYEYIEIIHGNDNIQSKVIELLGSAKRELISFVRPPFASYSRKMKAAQEEAYFRFVENGGKAISVYEVNEDSIPRMFNNIKSSYEYGEEQFRIAQKLPIKMFIFDREILLLTDDGELSNKGELTMSIIKQQSTVKGYLTLFNFIWDNGLDYESFKAAHPDLIRIKLREWEKGAD